MNFYHLRFLRSLLNLCLFLPLLAGGLLNVAQAQPLLLDVTDAHNATVSITHYVELLEDKSATMDLEKVQSVEMAEQFKATHGSPAAINLGLTSAAHWVRFTLINTGNSTVDRVLEIPYGISQIEFYQPTGDGGFQQTITGKDHPFASRLIPNRHFAFPVAVPAHRQQTYFLRIKSAYAITLPLNLWSPDDFRAHELTDYLFNGWYFGIAAAMILYNLMLYFSLRDKVLILYVATCLALAMGMAEYSGLTTEYLWPDAVNWAGRAISFWFKLTVALLILFVRRLLDAPQTLPRIDVGFRVLAALMFVSLIPSVLYPEYSIYWSPQLSGLAAVFLFMAVVYASRCGIRAGSFLLLAYSPFILMVVIMIASWMLKFPLKYEPAKVMQWASIFEMMVFSLAIADRFAQLRKEKETAQEQLIANISASEKKLEEQVAQRTEELKQANSTLVKRNEEQGYLVTMLNHEFKTPLAVIQMATLSEEFSDPLRNRIGRAVTEMTSLVERCVQLGRIEAGLVTIQHIPCDLKEIMSGIRDQQFNPDRIEIESDELPPVVSDPQLLHILLANLIDNALKYGSKDYPVKIKISTNPEDSIVSVNVINKPGRVGYPDPNRLFSKYYRAPKSHGETGSGLGMFIAAGLADMLSGQLKYAEVHGDIVFSYLIPINRQW